MRAILLLNLILATLASNASAQTGDLTPTPVHGCVAVLKHTLLEAHLLGLRAALDPSNQIPGLKALQLSAKKGYEELNDAPFLSDRIKTSTSILEAINRLNKQLRALQTNLAITEFKKTGTLWTRSYAREKKNWLQKVSDENGNDVIIEPSKSHIRELRVASHRRAQAALNNALRSAYRNTILSQAESDRSFDQILTGISDFLITYGISHRIRLREPLARSKFQINDFLIETINEDYKTLVRYDPLQALEEIQKINYGEIAPKLATKPETVGVDATREEVLNMILESKRAEAMQMLDLQVKQSTPANAIKSVSRLKRTENSTITIEHTPAGELTSGTPYYTSTGMLVEAGDYVIRITELGNGKSRLRRLTKEQAAKLFK